LGTFFFRDRFAQGFVTQSKSDIYFSGIGLNRWFSADVCARGLREVSFPFRAGSRQTVNQKLFHPTIKNSFWFVILRYKLIRS
jgi:hypothetical protein